MNKQFIKKAIEKKSYIEVINENFNFIEVVSDFLDEPYKVWTKIGLKVSLERLIYIDLDFSLTYGITPQSISKTLFKIVPYEDLCVMNSIVIYYRPEDKKEFCYGDNLDTQNPFNEFIKENVSFKYNAEKNIIYINAKKIVEDIIQNNADISTLESIIISFILMGIYSQNRLYNFITDNPVFDFDANIDDNTASINAENFAGEKICELVY